MIHLEFDWRLHSRKQLPVHRAVLDGFQHILRADVLRSSEVRERSCDLEDAVMRAGGEVHLLHGVLEVAVALRIELAVLADEPGSHGGIAGDAGFPEPPGLDVACLHDTQADGLGLLSAGGLGGKFLEVDQRHFDVEVDAVEQGAGDALAVVLDLTRRAAALALDIAVVSTRAGICFKGITKRKVGFSLERQRSPWNQPGCHRMELHRCGLRGFGNPWE